jgi:hypothetical protein
MRRRPAIRAGIATTMVAPYGREPVWAGAPTFMLELLGNRLVRETTGLNSDEPQHLFTRWRIPADPEPLACVSGQEPATHLMSMQT